MARERLSDKAARTAVPAGQTSKDGHGRALSRSEQKPRDAAMLCDGGGLYLQLTTGKDGNIRRSWIFRYKRKGHPIRDMGLGSINDIGLADARERARKYRVMVKDGKDPIKERDAEIARELAASVRVMTFEEAAETYIAQHRAEWKNPVHARQWPSTLSRYAFPVIGDMSVADIETEHVLKVLNPIWATKPPTAKNLRGRIEAVLGWATLQGLRKDEHGRNKDNPARWKDHLDNALPSPTKLRKVKPQPALKYAEMPRFMAELRQRQGISALALEFAILTAVRTADVRNAKKVHVDRAKRTWIIPEFSKTGIEHRVPLSNAALAAIDRAERITRGIGGAVAKSGFLFPNDVTGAALSVNAMLAVLARMGRKGAATTHGFRASFRTFMQERTNFPWELCELSLGHKVGTAVERAYARGDALKKRKAIMQRWADFCGKAARGTAAPRSSRPSNVVPLKHARA